MLVVQLLAQTPAAVAQVVSPELVIPIHMSVKEASEAPFPIELKYGDKTAQESWIEIVTLPATVTFSSGGVQRRGVWRVALAEARNLRIKVPAQTATDNGSIYVMLVEKGVIQTVATAKLVITPQPAAAIAEAASALPSQAASTDAKTNAPAAKEDKSPSAAKKLNRAEKTVDGTAPIAPAATASQPTPQATSKVIVAAPATPAVAPLPATPPAATTQTAAAAPVAPALPAAPVTPLAAPTQTAVVSPPAPAMTSAPATPPVATPQTAAVAPVAPALPPAPVPPLAAPTQTAAVSPPAPAIPPATTQPAPVAPPATSSPSPSAAAATAVVSPAAPLVAAPPAVTVQIQRLLSQGERNFAEGNISVARQYFTSAAELGSAIGAFKLAETNDPHELQKIQVVGLKPDVAEAIRWYRKASDLGMSEATERARRLQQR